MTSNPELPPDALEFIGASAAYLEKPSFLVRLTDVVGRPMEAGLRMLPRRARRAISTAVDGALRASLGLAIRTLDPAAPAGGSVSAADRQGRGTRVRHAMATTMTGGVAGFFGWWSLPVELPVTMTIMLRSIAAIAAEMGEDLSTMESRLECLSVFSFGSPSPQDDAAETSYLAQRIAMASAVQQAADFLARASARELAEAVQRGSAPVLVRLLARVAARLEIVVGEKTLAQAVPVVGAVGGALVNAAFTSHFNEVARRHFGLRRLEREHGADAVRDAYRAAARALTGR